MKSRIEVSTLSNKNRVAKLINTETNQHVATAYSCWLHSSKAYEGWKSHKMHHDCAIVNRSRSRKLHATPEQALARFV
jgi:hypothetical protein